MCIDKQGVARINQQWTLMCPIELSEAMPFKDNERNDRDDNKQRERDDPNKTSLGPTPYYLLHA